MLYCSDVAMLTVARGWP